MLLLTKNISKVLFFEDNAEKKVTGLFIHMHLGVWVMYCMNKPDNNKYK